MSSEGDPLPPWATACRAFHASRDFHKAWEILEAPRTIPGFRDHNPWPHQAQIVCATLALELALKARLQLEDREPARTHSYVRIFRDLSEAAREEIGRELLFNGEPGTSADVEVALQSLDDAAQPYKARGKPVGVFDAWRYVHEHSHVKFEGGTIVAVTIAIHNVILRLRPDWRGWPGVIQES